MVVNKARGKLRTVVRLFRSPYVAIALIAGFIIASSVGVLVPQEKTSGTAAVEAFRKAHPVLRPVLEAVDAFRVFQAPWFIALVGLLALSTLVCTVDQLARARRAAAFARSRAPVALDSGAAELILHGSPEVAAPRVEGLLRRLGLRVWRSGATFRAWNTTGRWGSPLFHFGLVLIFGAVVAGAALQWSTTVVLTEGQTFVPGQGPPHGYDQPWNRQAPDPARLPQLKLIKHYPRYARRGYAPDAASELVVDGVPRLLRWGAPLSVRGLTLHQGRRYGALVEVVLVPGGESQGAAAQSGPRDPGPGAPPAFGGLYPLPDGSFHGGLVFLNQQDAEKQVRVADLPPLRTTASFRLVPGPKAGRYELPFDRRFQLEVVVPPESPQARPVVLSVGESLTLARWRLEFRSLRYWTTLTLSAAPLTPLLFALAWWCVAMLALAALFPERRLELVLEGVGEGGAMRSRVRLRTWAGRGAFAFPERLKEALEGLNEEEAKTS